MIESFMREETRWLSNMAPCKIELDGAMYASTEHAYMSAKSNDPEWKELCQTETDPKKVKTKSREITLIEGWDQMKIGVMETVLRQKFNQEPYKSKLLVTGNQNIQEGNTWNDEFWGVNLNVVPNVGENWLGRLIMKIRDELHETRKEYRSSVLLDKNLFGDVVVPTITMTEEEVKGYLTKYGIPFAKYDVQTHRLVNAIVCLENELRNEKSNS